MNKKPFLFSLGRDKGKVGYYWCINSLLFLNDSGLFSFPIRAGMNRGSLKLQRERLKSSNNRFISNGNRTEWSAIKRRSAGSLLRTHILWARHGGRLRDQPKECVGGYAAGVRFLKSSMIIDRKSYYQLIIKISISEKRRISKLWKKGKIRINIPTKEA